MRDIESVTFRIDDTPSGESLQQLYESAGWGHANFPNMLEIAYRNSAFKVCVYDQSEVLIAAGRVLSDGVFTAYFADLLVHPLWQGKGLGTQIMRIMRERFKDFHNQVLVAEDSLAKSFYIKQGFCQEPAAMSIMMPFKQILP